MRMIPKRMGMGRKNAELFVEDDQVYVRVLSEPDLTYHTWDLEACAEDVSELLPRLEREPE